MRQGTCTECGSATIRAARNAISGQVGNTGQGSHTGLLPHIVGQHRGILRPFQGEVWSYACLTCGRFEHRIHDPATLDFIAKNWVPVTPAEAAPPAGDGAG